MIRILFALLLLAAPAYAQEGQAIGPNPPAGLFSVNGALKGNGSGTVTQSNCAGLSDAAASCATDATNATNISSGTLPNARIVALNTNISAAFSAGNLVSLAPASTFYFTYGDAVGTENVGAVPMSGSGTIKNMYASTNTGPGSSGGAQTYTVTFRKNAADQTLTCQMSAAASTCNDITHTFTYVAGDLVAIKLTTSATAAVANGFNIGFTIVTTSP